MNSEERLEKWFAQMDQKVLKAAEAAAQYHHLQHFRKHLLALLSEQNMAAGASSVARAENQARASDDYRAHLRALEVAEVSSALAAWEVEKSKTRIDIWRTQEATRRVEMGMR